MSDLELLELIHNKPPGELSSAEIQVLRQGLATSAELRREMSERVEMEAYLYVALGRIDVSADDVIRRAALTRSGSPLALTRWGLAAAVLAGIAVGGLLVLAINATRSSQQQLVQELPGGTAEQKLPIAHRAGAGEETEPPSAPSPSDLLLSSAAQQRLGVTDQMAQTTQSASEPPAPWQQVAPTVEATPVSANELYRTLNPNEPPLAADDLKRWLEPVPGHRSNFGSEDIHGSKWGQMEGLLRLKAPLASGHALRLTVWDWGQLKIHAWAGNAGATLRLLAKQQLQPWVGYATLRKDANPIPQQCCLAATDDDRSWKTNPRNPVTLQLRHADGLLTLSHGAIRLLDVPMNVPPTEIYLEGTAALRELAIVPAAALPTTRLAPPRIKTIIPTSQTWTDPADGTGTLWRGADGSIELRTEKNRQAAIAKLEIQRSGVTEFVCAVRDPQPGTGIALIDGEGNPAYLAGFARNKAADSVQIGSMAPHQPTLHTHGDLNRAVVPLVGSRTWIKLTLASGWVKLAVSVDGRHFARAGNPTHVERPIVGIGLLAMAHPSPRSLRLTELELHQLEAINQLVPTALQERAEGLTAPQTLADLRTAASQIRPAEVDSADWLRACAVRALATGVNPTLGEELVEYLWQDCLYKEMSLERCLQVLEQLSIVWPGWNNRDLAERHARRYEELGRTLAEHDRGSPYSKIALPQMRAPLEADSRFDFFPAALARHEALELALDQRWKELADLVDRLNFYHFPEESKRVPFYRWLESLAGRQQPEAGGAARTVATVDWRHPLTTDLNKEGFNVLADLRVALESKAYRDACQVIGAAGAGGMFGLLPDAEDPNLTVSLPATVALAMREDPQFRTTMADEFGALGRLRVRQAIAAGNANAVSEATLQFYGTEAAAEAHAWLADRAISSGAFAAAQSHYRAARATAAADLLARLAASEQLAAALMGQDAGFTPNGTLVLGGTQIPAREMIDVSAQLRTARASENALGGVAVADPNEPQAAQPGQYEPVVRGRLEGEAGRNPQNIPPEYQQPGPAWPSFAVDWVAEQVCVRSLVDRLLISNRFQLSSYDPATGTLQWRAGLGGDMAPTHEWPLAPMRPIVASDMAFVRRLRAAGPTLAAIELANGQPKWETRLDGEHWVVSDPILVGSTLYACTVRHNDLGYRLSLGAFDPQTGVVLREQTLVDLRDTWGQIRDCQMLRAEESFVITCGGAVLRCDLMGNLRWARKRFWIPPVLDPGWTLQAHQPPILADNRLVVLQPCVPGVVALDPDNGRLVWRNHRIAARRTLGATETHIFLATTDGVCAIDSKTGQRTWNYPANLLRGSLLSKTDGLLIATSQPLEGERDGCPTLTWLDPTTGQPTYSCPLSALKQQHPMLGPLFISRDHIWGIYGQDPRTPHRDLIELAPK